MNNNIFLIFGIVYVLTNACCNVAMARNDALNKYNLTGAPAMLFHRTFEVTVDSLTGEPIIGKEVDSTPSESFRVNFNQAGQERSWHYISKGRSCSCQQYSVTSTGNPICYQIYENMLESFIVEEPYLPERKKDDLQISSYLSNLYSTIGSISISLLQSDTIYVITRNGILLTKCCCTCSGTVVYEYSYAEGEDGRGLWEKYLPEAVRPNVLFHRKYQDGKLIVELGYDDCNSRIPEKEKYFEYNKDGLLVFERESCLSDESNYEEHDFIYLNADTIFPSSDSSFTQLQDNAIRCKYVYDSPVDNHGNWRSRFVYYVNEDKSCRTAWYERRTIKYHNIPYIGYGM